MPPLSSIVIVGAAGQVGTQLARQLGPDHAIGAGRHASAPAHLAGTPWRAFDLAQAAHQPTLANDLLQSIPQPAAVLCVAGATDVDRCESERDWAFAVNAHGPAALAAATPSSVPFVYFSTEYVFDGDTHEDPGPYLEDSPTNPLSVYGQSKLLGEQLILAARPDALILRTTVVYGEDPARKNFLYFLHRELSANRPIRVVTDQISTPTPNDDLARATLLLLGQRQTGIVHVCGPDLLSRYDFALRAAHLLDLDARLIHPITTASLNQRAPRPLAAGLRTDKLRTLLGPTIIKATDDGILHWARHSLATPQPAS